MPTNFREMLDDTLSSPLAAVLILAIPLLLPLALLCCLFLYVGQGIWLSIAELCYTMGSSFTPEESKAIASEPPLSPRERQMAWSAFAKHTIATRPEAFEGVKRFGEKLRRIKLLREDDTAAYDAFVAEWIQTQKQLQQQQQQDA